jgi:putative phage-type endonuclease
MNILKVEQGSEAWYEAKLGVVSTSNFDKVLNTGSGRGLYMRKLAAERLTGITQVGYSNENMENGLDIEPQAREYYEGLKGYSIEQVGFIKRDDWVGTSPDGLVSNDGQIEIKCPIPSTHIENILKAKMPTFYRSQVQGQLWVTERKWCDWISYCPTIKDRPFFSVRVFRDEKYIKVLEIAVEQFVNELKEMITKITEGAEF